MRTRILICLLAVPAIMMLGGCDMFRKMAGRPTSADIQAKREYIAADMARKAEQARQDSIAAAEQRRIADSVAVMDSIRNSDIRLRPVSSFGRLRAAGIDKKYYIIVGSFSSEGNVSVMMDKVRNCGYEPVRIDFNNGLTAVGACPSDDVGEVFRNLKKVRKESFCPEDVWILVNN